MCQKRIKSAEPHRALVFYSNCPIFHLILENFHFNGVFLWDTNITTKLQALFPSRTNLNCQTVQFSFYISEPKYLCFAAVKELLSHYFQFCM